MAQRKRDWKLWGLILLAIGVMAAAAALLLTLAKLAHAADGAGEWQSTARVISINGFDPLVPDGAWVQDIDLPSTAREHHVTLEEPDQTPAQDVGVLVTLVGVRFANDGGRTLTYRVARVIGPEDFAHTYILRAWWREARDRAPRALYRVPRIENVTGHLRHVNMGRGRIVSEWQWHEPAVIRAAMGWPVGCGLEFER